MARSKQRRLAAALVLATWLAGAPTALASGATRHYDLKTLPLELALANFADVSGVDILYDEANAKGRRSAAVTGDFTAPVALERLLQGTGLVSGFTSSQSAVIFPVGQPPPSLADKSEAPVALELDVMVVTPPLLIGGRASAYEAYARSVLIDIRRSLTEARIVVARQTYETRISTQIGHDGALHDVRILRPTRDGRRDAQVAAVLDGLHLATEPPPNLPQPLIFDISLQ